MATQAASQGRKFLPARKVRQATRCQVQLTGTAKSEGADTDHEVTLHDVSSYGCRVAATIDVEVGERIALRLGGGLPVTAIVVWIESDMIGCRFDRRLDRKLARSLTLTCH